MIAGLLLAACGLLSGSYTYGNPGERISDTSFPMSRAMFRVLATPQGLSLSPAFYGDRAFTTLESNYDTGGYLVEAAMHQSCCGSSYSLSVRTGEGGRTVISAERDDVPEHAEKITIERPRSDAPLLFARDFILYPYLFGALHRDSLFELHAGLIEPFETPSIDTVRLTASNAAAPPGVPADARALAVRRNDPYRSETIWYDPCTYVMYAYDEAGSLHVLLH